MNKKIIKKLKVLIGEEGLQDLNALKSPEAIIEYFTELLEASEQRRAHAQKIDRCLYGLIKPYLCSGISIQEGDDAKQTIQRLISNYHEIWQRMEKMNKFLDEIRSKNQAIDHLAYRLGKLAGGVLNVNQF